jgi:hypothetical protein
MPPIVLYRLKYTVITDTRYIIFISTVRSTDRQVLVGIRRLCVAVNGYFACRFREHDSLA